MQIKEGKSQGWETKACIEGRPTGNYFAAERICDSLETVRPIRGRIPAQIVLDHFPDEWKRAKKEGVLCIILSYWGGSGLISEKTIKGLEAAVQAEVANRAKKRSGRTGRSSGRSPIYAR